MQVVLIASDVVLPLMLLPEKLQLLNDLGLVEDRLDTLVVEEDYPEAGSRIGLDQRVLHLLRTQEGQQAGQEMRIGNEVQLGGAVEGSVTQEQKIMANQVDQCRILRSLNSLRLRRYCVQDKQAKFIKLLKFLKMILITKFRSYQKNLIPILAC
jgi:hypothetical protein